MEYAQLGTSGPIVSRLALGSLTFALGDHGLASVYKVGAELADHLVGRALDAGVNFFDTADAYADGEAERLLGAALKPHRQRVVLATKVGNRGGARSGLSRQNILSSVDESLKRLGTDWIDLYIAHREDPFTPIEETLAAFDTIVRAGKVCHIGFSNWSAWTAAAAMEIQKAEGFARFTHGQIYYSLLGRDVERDLVPMMQHYGLGMTVWSPLAFGFLSGAYTRESLSRPDNRFSDFDLLQFDRDKAFALIDVLRRIADARSTTVPRVAIAWLLARPGVTSVILGVTKLAQLDDNLAAIALELAEDDLAELDAATAVTPIYPTSQWISRRARKAR